MTDDEPLDELEEAMVETGGVVWTGRGVDELLAAGRSLDGLDDFGFTPLHWSIDKQDRVRFVRLLEAGADPNVGTLHFDTPPLIFACELDTAFWAERLLEHGASPSCSDRRLDTPIMIACREGRAETVALLLSRGADPTVTKSGDLTIVDAALESLDRATVVAALGAGVVPRLDLATRLCGAALWKRPEHVVALAALRDLLPFDPASWTSIAEAARTELDDWDAEPDDAERGEEVLELIRRFSGE